MEALLNPQAFVALLTLTILEVVLAVDNVIFIAIVSGGLPKEKRAFAQRVGLGLALVGRIVLVLGISWMLRLERTLFAAFGHDVSFSDIILIGGGLFLLYKAVVEIFNTTELKDEEAEQTRRSATMGGTVAQIVVVDLIFAVDSVLTAVGLTQQIALIIIAMTIAILVMMFFATPLSEFVHEHPSVKVLALAFLVLVGVMLLLDGFGQHIERGYVYFAILFSLGVEALNFRRQANLARKRGEVSPESGTV